MMDNKWALWGSLKALAAAIVLAVPLLVPAGPAAAQEGEGQPDAADEQSALPPGQWVKRCSQRETGLFCEISFGRFVELADRQVWLSRAGVFESGENKDLFVFVPLGAALRRGLAFRVDTNEPKVAEYSVCLQIQGCQAITPIDPAMIASMKAGNELQIQFTLGNRPPLITKVSLAGFTAAYDGAPSEIVEEEPQEGADGAADAAGGKGDAPGDTPSP